MTHHPPCQLDDDRATVRAHGPNVDRGPSVPRRLARLATRPSRSRSSPSHGGTIVEVVHDIGESRSVPWKRRPAASALLDRVRQGHHGFDAIVVGEVQRAFGNIEQAMTTLPLLTHFGVGFWAPELGGRYDPLSESAEILLGAFVGMSRAERQRIKVRVKAAMSEQAKDGRWLGGRPPYGYRLVDTATPHPNPNKAREGRMLRALVVDPPAAEVVRSMFDDVRGRAHGLQVDRQRASPSRACCRHRRTTPTATGTASPRTAPGRRAPAERS